MRLATASGGLPSSDPPPVLVEVIVTSASDAVAAVRGGADRLELVSAPERGGLTPSPDVLRSVLDVVDVPVRVMLRAADDDALSDPESLRRTAARLSVAGAAEFVVGGLAAGAVDPRTADVVPVGAHWTFHRALDAAPSFVEACRAALALRGCDTVLVAGHPDGLDAGGDRLRELLASGTVASSSVLVGGGVRSRHLPGLLALGVRAVHLGRAVRRGGSWSGAVDAADVASARRALGSA